MQDNFFNFYCVMLHLRDTQSFILPREASSSSLQAFSKITQQGIYFVFWTNVKHIPMAPSSPPPFHIILSNQCQLIHQLLLGYNSYVGILGENDIINVTIIWKLHYPFLHSSYTAGPPLHLANLPLVIAFGFIMVVE